MILFNGVMQTEKIAIIVLALIVVGALSAFLVSSNSEEIFGNLFDKEVIIQAIHAGLECAFVSYY